MKRWILAFFLFTGPCFASRTLTDDLGRTVVVPDHPHRLICLLPSVVDDVYSLGAGDDILAVTDYTKFPAAARSKPTIGEPLNPSLEAILALHPDLVLGSGDMNQLQTADQLQHYGIPVFMVNPHGLAGIYTSLASLGTALNRPADATRLIHSLQAREEAVRERVGGKAPVRVFMPIWYDPIITIGKHAFITEIIEAAGGVSITSDIGEEWPQVSLEAVVARHPDALLLTRGSRMTLADLIGRPGWDALSPLRTGRIYYADNRIEFPSPIAIDALEDLAKQFHP